MLALVTPLLAGNRREGWKLGAAFAFAVSASYLWSANTDPKTLAHLELLVPAIVVTSLFGLLCAAGGWRGSGGGHGAAWTFSPYPRMNASTAQAVGATESPPPCRAVRRG